jgi:DNA-binding NarL/FixJ family response regulator
MPGERRMYRHAGKAAACRSSGRRRGFGKQAAPAHPSDELHNDLALAFQDIEAQAQAALDALAAGDVAGAGALLAGLIAAAASRAAQVAGDNPRLFDSNDVLGLSPHGFYPALAYYLRQVGQIYGLHITLSLPDDDDTILDELAPEAQVQLLRIMQEALAGVYRDAHAHTAQVILTRFAGQVQVIIVDDGVGFDLARPPAGDGRPAGVALMQQYAAAAGGSVQVRSAPGQGTHVIVMLPLSTSENVAPLAGMRLLLADDHPLILEAVRRMLTDNGAEIVGVAHDGQEAITQALALRPDVILMDIHMPQMTGLEATRRIKAEQPGVKVVILTVSADDEDLFEAVRAGATGYLLKTAKADEFVAQLSLLARGEAPLAAGLTGRLLAGLANAGATGEPGAAPRRNLPPELSARQIEIVRLMAGGLTYKEIGALLHLSEHTVKYHMEQIMSRLGLSGRAAVTAYARRVGLI